MRELLKKKRQMGLTCLEHSNAIGIGFVSLKDALLAAVMLSLAFTSIRSMELDDVGGSQLNSSRVFLNVALIPSPQD